MAFCNKCGTQVEDNVQFCPQCGNNLQQPAPAQSSFSDQFNNVINTADTTAEFDPRDIEQNKVFAVLAYFGILVLIPILAAPQSKFARYHANQGLLLTIASFAFGLVAGMITAILVFVSPFLAGIGVLFGLVGIVFLVFMILGIVNAATGKAKELPILGKIRLLK